MTLPPNNAQSVGQLGYPSSLFSNQQSLNRHDVCELATSQIAPTELNPLSERPSPSCNRRRGQHLYVERRQDCFAILTLYRRQLEQSCSFSIKHLNFAA